jgi:hypothetical protein
MISSFQSYCLTGAVVVFSAGSLTFAEDTKDSNKDPKRYYAKKQVRLTLGNTILNIGIAEDGTSLVVWSEGSKTPTRIGPSKENQREQAVSVTDFVAQGFEYGGDQVGVAIGFATLDETENKLDYQFAWGYAPEDQLSEPGVWYFSGSLLSCGANNPFQSMSVSITHGDSVSFSIQRIDRKDANKTEIETHVFVNHCPIALIKETTMHYKTVLADSENTPDILHVPK